MQSYKVTDRDSKKGYHQLIVWQKSRFFVKDIYLVTEKFPLSEQFGLVSQIRRASISVVLNIVEGSKRSSKKDFLHFLNIADGSLTEVEACLEIALDLGYITVDELYNLEVKRQEIAVMLSAFIKSIKKSL